MSTSKYARLTLKREEKTLGEVTIQNLEKVIGVVCRAIKRQKDCPPEKLLALSRLANSLCNLESLRGNPIEEGTPEYYESLGD
jgi:hypothetical protein